MSYQQPQQQQQGQPESVVVNGMVEGMEVKGNGRFVIKVREIGSTSQYALSLNTKEQGLAQQMSQSIGQQFSFICGLSHWTNNQGQPVTSKWINGVAPLQGGMQQQAPMQAPMQQAPMYQPDMGQQQQPMMQPPPQPQPMMQPQGGYQPPPMQQSFPPQQQIPMEDGRPTDDAYIRRVSWLAALEPAVAMLGHLPENQRGVAALVKMADFFAQVAIKRGQQGFPALDQPAQQPMQQQPQQQYQQGDPGPQPGDPGYPTPTDDDIPF